MNWGSFWLGFGVGFAAYAVLLAWAIVYAKKRLVAPEER